MNFWSLVLATPDPPPNGGGPIPILTGSLGVLSGFAVCFSDWLRFGNEKTAQSIGVEIAAVAVLLLVAALVTFSIEYIRDVIKHDVEISRSEDWGRQIGTFFLICFLEAFVIAFEGGVDHWNELVTFAKAVLPIGMYAYPYPDVLPDLTWVVVASSALLWLAIGCFVAEALDRLVRVAAAASVSRQPTAEPLGRVLIRCGGRGALIGLLWAPLGAFALVVVLRVLVFIETFFVDPKRSTRILVDRWQAAFTPRGGWYGWPSYILWAIHKTGVSVFSELTAHWPFLAKSPTEYFFAAFIIIAVLVASVALVAAILHWRLPAIFILAGVGPLLVAVMNAVLVPIFGPLFSLSSALLTVWVATVFCWSIPATGLGLAVPLLRDPATHPPCWAVVSAIAGVFTVALAVVWRSGWPLIMLLLPVLGVVTFALGLSLIDHWGLAAISLSIILIGCASIANNISSFAAFFGGALKLTQQQTLPAWMLPPRVAPEYQPVLAYVREEVAKKAPLMVNCGTDESCLNETLVKALPHAPYPDLISPAESLRTTLVAYVSCQIGQAYECDNKLREVIDQEYKLAEAIKALGSLGSKRGFAPDACSEHDLYSIECIKALFQPQATAAVQPDNTNLLKPENSNSDKWAVRLNICQIFCFSFWTTTGLLASRARRCISGRVLSNYETDRCNLGANALSHTLEMSGIINFQDIRQAAPVHDIKPQVWRDAQGLRTRTSSPKCHSPNYMAQSFPRYVAQLPPP